MKSLSEYVSESQITEADLAPDLSNAVVKALNAACTKNGYRLVKAFLSCGTSPVVVVAPASPGFHPRIEYSCLNRRNPITIRFDGDEVYGTKGLQTYVNGMKAGMAVVKAIESADLSKLPVVK